MTILSQCRRQYTTDCTCIGCAFFFNLKDFCFVLFCFVLLGIVFQLRLFLSKSRFYFKYIKRTFDYIFVYIWHTSIMRPPLLSGHLAIPRGWPLNRGSTVVVKIAYERRYSSTFLFSNLNFIQYIFKFHLQIIQRIKKIEEFIIGI